MATFAQASGLSRQKPRHKGEYRQIEEALTSGSSSEILYLMNTLKICSRSLQEQEIL